MTFPSQVRTITPLSNQQRQFSPWAYNFTARSFGGASFVSQPFNGSLIPMGIEYKQGAQARIPVVLQKSTDGSALTGITYSGVTATIEYADGTTASVSPADGAHWVELSAGAFSGSGTYNLLIDAGSINKTGIILVIISVATASLFKIYAKIVANEEVDTYTAVIKQLGLSYDNTVMDSQVFDTNGNLTSARVRCYDNSTDAMAGGLTGLLYTFTIFATYDTAGRCTLYRQTGP